MAFDFKTRDVWSIVNKYAAHSKFTIEKHPSTDLYIVGYHNRKPGLPIVWDEINKQLRGLIIDKQGNIVARSFPKFFTFKDYLTTNRIILGSGDTVKIPDCGYKIYEKVDGTMSILYWVDGKPFLASQRSFTSPNAVKATEILYSKYIHLFSKLRKDVTYIFEAIYPNTKVMVNYDEREDLVLIGQIENNTGLELPLEDIGFPVAKEYTTQYGHINDFEELAKLDIPNLEGFVITYENHIKIKIKFPWFSEAHALADKIIMQNYFLLENKKKLSNLLGFEHKKVSNIDIWDCLKNSKTLETIMYKVPEDYYSTGFEVWVNEIVQELNEQKAKILEEQPNIENGLLWNSIKPATELTFDTTELLYSSKHCTPMWNFVSRLKNAYL